MVIPWKLKLTTQEVFAALAHSNTTGSQEIKIATIQIISITPDAPVPTPIITTINATADPTVGENDTFTVTGKRQLAPRSVANGAKLRILCLGASITTGYLSTDGNGYRYGLRSKLVQGGNVVNMVGSLASGRMADNNNEGWIGYRIEQTAEKAELSLPSLPNIVLVHVGSKTPFTFSRLCADFRSKRYGPEFRRGQCTHQDG